MLVLTRRVGERIFIGKDVVLRVMKINDRSVRIGFDAPRSVAIVREEVAGKYPERNE